MTDNIDFRVHQLLRIVQNGQGRFFARVSSAQKYNDMESVEQFEFGNGGLYELRRNVVQNGGNLAQTNAAAKIELFENFQRFIAGKSPFMQFGIVSVGHMPFTQQMCLSIQGCLYEKKCMNFFVV